MGKLRPTNTLNFYETKGTIKREKKKNERNNWVQSLLLQSINVKWNKLVTVKYCIPLYEVLKTVNSTETK